MTAMIAMMTGIRPDEPLRKTLKGQMRQIEHFVEQARPHDSVWIMPERFRPGLLLAKIDDVYSIAFVFGGTCSDKKQILWPTWSDFNDCKLGLDEAVALAMDWLHDRTDEFELRESTEEIDELTEVHWD
jgi:hypothetical protein